MKGWSETVSDNVPKNLCGRVVRLQNQTQEVEMASQGDQEMGTGKPEEVEEALEEAGFGTSRLPASRHTSRHPRPGGHSATPPEGRSKKSRTCSVR